MTADDDNDEKPASPGVLPFPFSRVSPSQTADDGVAVVYGAFVSLIGVPHDQTKGYWCSQCRKIWYGLLFEVACPVCGNRHG